MFYGNGAQRSCFRTESRRPPGRPGAGQRSGRAGARLWFRPAGKLQGLTAALHQRVAEMLGRAFVQRHAGTGAGTNPQLTKRLITAPERLAEVGPMQAGAQVM